MVYRLKVAGVERDLPICPISERLMIAGFVMLGDTELTEACAEGLCRLLPEGKGRMNAADYIRGRKIAVGDVLKYE